MRGAFLVILAVLMFGPSALAAQDVSQTLHNLSRSGPGTVKSTTADEVCAFCHTPHGGIPQTPGWNKDVSGQIYLEYDSTTMQAAPGQPSGSSQLCLSCHDGTIALGLLRQPITGAGDGSGLLNTFLSTRANLDTDLSDDHPISFSYNHTLAAADGNLENPDLTGLPLENQNLECATCHDAHEKDIIPFLRKATANGELCLTCHIPGSNSWSWAQTAHAQSAATDPSGGAWAERKPEWRGTNVSENACFNCHTPDSGQEHEQQVKKNEETTCALCHDGGVAAKNIMNDLNKISRHRVSAYSGIHKSNESFAPNPPTKHVECEDCHNPHAANDATASAPMVSGPLVGVSGIDSDGVQVDEAANQYEVCYKCHADHPAVTSSSTMRQITEFNTRVEFDVANPSYHPVEGAGKNSFVPSLLSPLTVSSQIYCTDCHASDEDPTGGGSGAAGPHGSIYEPLLTRNYSTADNTVESTVAYALCYKCHDRTSILANESFPEHRKHIVEENSPCSACHDPHGIDANAGNPINNSNLINFDLSIVTPNSQNQGPVFEDAGHRAGSCYLSCHGEDHSPCGYGGAAGNC